MPKKILLVDDHPAYSSALAASLKFHGYDVCFAQDGESALKVAEKQQPDLILLDIMMPRMGGTEVRAELLKQAGTKDIPTIFLTGLRPPQFAARPKPTAGGSGVRTVGKSDDIKELLTAIRDVLGN